MPSCFLPQPTTCYCISDEQKVISTQSQPTAKKQGSFGASVSNWNWNSAVGELRRHEHSVLLCGIQIRETLLGSSLQQCDTQTGITHVTIQWTESETGASLTLNEIRDECFAMTARSLSLIVFSDRTGPIHSAAVMACKRISPSS